MLISTVVDTYCAQERPWLTWPDHVGTATSLPQSQRQLSLHTEWRINWDLVDRDVSGDHGRVIVFTAHRGDWNPESQIWCNDDDVDCKSEHGDWDPRVIGDTMTHGNMRCEGTNRKRLDGSRASILANRCARPPTPQTSLSCQALKIPIVSPLWTAAGCSGGMATATSITTRERSPCSFTPGHRPPTGT